MLYTKSAPGGFSRGAALRRELAAGQRPLEAASYRFSCRSKKTAAGGTQPKYGQGFRMKCFCFRAANCLAVSPKSLYRPSGAVRKRSVIANQRARWCGTPRVFPSGTIPRIFKHLGRKTKLFPSNRGAATPVTSVTGSQRHTFLTAPSSAY